MINWIWITEKNDIRYLLKDVNPGNLPETKGTELQEAFEKIYWQYLEEMGLSQKSKLMIETEASIVLLEAKAVIEDTNKYYTKITESKIKLANYRKSNDKEQSFTERLAFLGKTLGMVINPMTTTLYNYIGIEKMHTKLVEAQNGSNKR